MERTVSHSSTPKPLFGNWPRSPYGIVYHLHITAFSRERAFLQPTPNSILPRPIAAVFERVTGLVAWQVAVDIGSFLTLEFGDPKLTISEREKAGHLVKRHVSVHGEWHLRLECCQWTIEQFGTQLAHSESNNDLMKKAARQLDGQRLIKLWMQPDTVITHFEFDLGGKLTTYPYENENEDDLEQWVFYEPEGLVLSVRADNQFCHMPENTHPDDQRWDPIVHLHA